MSSAPEPGSEPASGPGPGALRRLVLGRVLRRRCPQCGEGRLFERYARVAPSCAVCGHVFRREAGAQTGSMYVTATVTQVFAVLLIGALVTAVDDAAVRRALLSRYQHHQEED